MKPHKITRSDLIRYHQYTKGEFMLWPPNDWKQRLSELVRNFFIALMLLLIIGGVGVVVIDVMGQICHPQEPIVSYGELHSAERGK